MTLGVCSLSGRPLEVRRINTQTLIGNNRLAVMLPHILSEVCTLLFFFFKSVSWTDRKTYLLTSFDVVSLNWAVNQ